MYFSWEALTAVAALVSSVAVFAAVVVATRQVRVGAAQVEHLRRATQLDGTMKIFAMLASPEQQMARRFIATELEDRLQNDPAFREGTAPLIAAPSLDDHPELHVLRLMEMIGVYVKYGLLDADIVFDYWGPVVLETWRLLDRLGILATYRRVDPSMWENFDELYRRAERWIAAPPLMPVGTGAAGTKS